MTRDEYRQHVAEVLLKVGYRFTDEDDVELIVESWSNQEEFDADYTDREIVLMYEIRQARN